MNGSLMAYLLHLAGPGVEDLRVELMAEPEHMVDDTVSAVLPGQPHDILDPLFIWSEAQAQLMCRYFSVML